MGSSSSRPRPRPGEMQPMQPAASDGPAYTPPQYAPGPPPPPPQQQQQFQTNGQLYGYAPPPFVRAAAAGAALPQPALLPPPPPQLTLPLPGPTLPPPPPQPPQLPHGPPQLTPLPGIYGQPPRPMVEEMHTQTQTIKNTVNLRKKTLALQPAAHDPNELCLQFVFDASAPCRVTTFLLATEDPRQACRIVGAVPEPRVPVYYDRGMERRFPPDAAAARAHAIHLGRHAPELLTLAGGQSYPDSFPLIIRIEALTHEAAAEGRQLQQLEVGGALPAWAQAQSSYVKLTRDDDGHWGLAIIKQKIWVGGTSYELQEIYGMEASRTGGGAAGGGGGAAEDVDGRECVICMSAERDTTVLPCRHMCMCQPCAAALRLQTNKCPICREPIESLLHIKIQQGGRRPGG